jgi:hypothetical protein
MSNLIEQIKAAQREAGECAVIDSLRGKGLVVDAARHWTETATHDQLANYCRHAEDDLRVRDEVVARLRAENNRWRATVADVARSAARDNNLQIYELMVGIEREVMTPNAK